MSSLDEFLALARAYRNASPSFPSQAFAPTASVFPTLRAAPTISSKDLPIPPSTAPWFPGDPLPGYPSTVPSYSSDVAAASISPRPWADRPQKNVRPFVEQNTNLLGLDNPAEGPIKNLQSKTGATGPTELAIMLDARCRRVQDQCIEHCSDTTLGTSDHGFSFFNCKNQCMQAHGCPSVLGPG